MNKQQAEKVAKQMIKSGASAYAGRNSLAAYNKGKVFTEHATEKVLHAFRLAVIKSKRYSVVHKLYAAEQLGVKV